MDEKTGAGHKDLAEVFPGSQNDSCSATVTASAEISENYEENGWLPHRQNDRRIPGYAPQHVQFGRADLKLER